MNITVDQYESRARLDRIERAKGWSISFFDALARGDETLIRRCRQRLDQLGFDLRRKDGSTIVDPVPQPHHDFAHAPR